MKQGLRIVEGISGTWYYHLQQDITSRPSQALCGARIMATGLPVSYWGKTPPNHHIPEKWCAVCAKLAEPK
jgi:hypothetical protein